MMKEEFAKALIEVQSEIKTMSKNKKGYGYTYTDLDTIISNIKPILHKHGIGFMQIVKTLENGHDVIETTVFHSSGESLTSFVKLPCVSGKGMNEAQVIGSAITYMRRYSLCAIFGISSDEDTDGNVQQTRPPVQNRPAQNNIPKF